MKNILNVLLILILISGIACKHNNNCTMTCDVLNIQLTNPSLYKKAIPIFNTETSNSSTFNRVPKFGYLYNWYVASSPKIAPNGWHVPSAAEISDLITYLGGNIDAGPKVRDSNDIYWLIPNAGNNSSKFSLRGSGNRDNSGAFTYFKEITNVWASTQINATLAYCGNIWWDYSTSFSITGIGKKFGNIIRFIKDNDSWTDGETITDIEGNIYPTVKIGNQVWMAANYICTKFNDGSDIPNITNNITWANSTTGAYCAYNNDITNVYESIQYVTISSKSTQNFISESYIANSVQVNPITINHIIFQCDNSKQSLNPLKEVLNTMWGDSVESLVNLRMFTSPEYPDNSIIDIYLDNPITISANEFMQMDLEALTDVNLILEYCQGNTDEIVNNNNNQNQNTISISSINDNEQIVKVIESKPKVASVNSFSNWLILAAISFGVYKIYLNIIK
jgi:uncharacterized protein (TIGR02145 family)